MNHELSVLFLAGGLVLAVAIGGYWYTKTAYAKAGLVQKYDSEAKQILWVKP